MATLKRHQIPSTQLFSGHMKLVEVPYKEQLEYTDSKEFADLADNLEAIVSLTFKVDDVTLHSLSNSYLVFFLTILVNWSTRFPALKDCSVEYFKKRF